MNPALVPDMTQQEQHYMTAWASRLKGTPESPSALFNVEDVMRLVIARRAVQAGYYNNGAGECEITRFPLPGEWIDGYQEWRRRVA